MEVNLYDKIEIDIAAKHKEINENISFMSRMRHERNMVRSVFDKLLFVTKIYPRLVDSSWYRAWFKEFEEYWVKCLGGRPLWFSDFTFLYGWYRKEFQSVGLEDEKNMEKFLHAYQDPRNIYLTFSCVYKLALSPYPYFPYKKYLKRGDKILEYGAGIAPITTSLLNDGKSKYHFTIADISNFTFHYAKWRLKQFGVTCIDIDPAKIPELAKKYNVIFLMTVMEHLPNPLEVIKNLTEHLEIGGYFVFDFILSDGDGLDTQAALDQRESVLKFIEEHYTIVLGEIKYKESMGRTVAQKKM